MFKLFVPLQEEQKQVNQEHLLSGHQEMRTAQTELTLLLQMLHQEVHLPELLHQEELNQQDLLLRVREADQLQQEVHVLLRGNLILLHQAVTEVRAGHRQEVQVVHQVQGQKEDKEK